VKKKEFDLFVKAGLRKEEDAKTIIQSLIDWLINRLYTPDPDLIKVVDNKLVAELGLDEEAINWGHLKCYDVEKAEDRYIAWVNEANPTAYNLQRYLEGWLQKWGWNVKVITEW